jgi:hypothetical protein
MFRRPLHTDPYPYALGYLLGYDGFEQLDYSATILQMQSAWSATLPS